MNNKKDKKFVSGNLRAVTGAGLAASGLGLAASSATLPLREKISLTPGSKRVAIVYPGGKHGSGHVVPTMALQQAYLKKGYQVDLYDIGEHQNLPTKRFISKEYAKRVAANPVEEMPTLTQYDMPSRGKAPTPLWEEIANPKLRKPSLHRSEVGKELWNVISGHERVVRELKKKPYERIIAMHGMTGDVLKHVGVPVDVVATDYIPDPFAWKTPAAGKYFVANATAKKRFTDIGVPEHKVQIMGSLIARPEFKTPHKIPVPADIAAHRTANPKSRIVTVMGGGTGIQVEQMAEHVSKYYAAKDPGAKVIAITGNNAAAHSYLTNKQAAGELPRNLIVKRFEPTAGYLKHSDIVVTRPGGSTTAELLHTGTPTITFNHADVPSSFERIGSHEHGNVKMLHAHGMSRHFQTKYNPQDPGKITNMEDLSSVLNDVEANIGSLRQHGARTSAKFTKLSPESVIMGSKPGVQRALKLRQLGKIGIGAGLLAAGAGAYMYAKARKEKRGPILKVGEDHSKKKKLLLGTALAAGAALVPGAVAGSIFPGIRGNRGRILGTLAASKRLWVDIPLYTATKGKFGKSLLTAFGMPESKKLGDKLIDPIIRLTPTKIIEGSEATLASKGVDISKLTHEQRRIQSSVHDLRSTIKLLQEQETTARKAGITKMIGASHFAPAQAARFGYKESNIIAPSMQRFITKVPPFDYYRSERVRAQKFLKAKGLHEATPMHAYWMTAPHESVRLFEKDLTIPHEQAVAEAQAQLKAMSPERVKFLTETEERFKKHYDTMLLNIARAKDKAVKA